MFENPKLPAIVLAGGLGTRLRSVEAEKPKPMVEILGKPFLYWLVLSLQSVGFEHIIFSIGFKAAYIQNYPWAKLFPNFKFEFLTEENPLGTGGAVKNIFEIKKDLDEAWIVNGDTLLENPPPPFKASDDDVLYTALSSEQVFDAKSNLIVSGNHIVEVRDGAGTFFDGGQVFISKKAIEKFKGQVPCSFHKLVEKSFKEGRVGFLETPGTCYDIGTPERLKRFEDYLIRRGSAVVGSGS
jgi:D-glycero-alpha-D-manno-heptose 1-phosphate guanylyltransferase